MESVQWQKEEERFAAKSRPTLWTCLELFWQVLHPWKNGVYDCTLHRQRHLYTYTVSSLFLSSFFSSAYPQTDTLQLYNTHPHSCTWNEHVFRSICLLCLCKTWTVHTFILTSYSSGETRKHDEEKFVIWRNAEFSSEAARCILRRVDGWQRGASTRNEVGGSQSGKLRSRVPRHIKSDDQIATTWLEYSSGNGRSSERSRYCWSVQLLRKRRNWRVFRNGNSVIGFLLWWREKQPRGGFNTVWTQTLPNTFRISEQSRDIMEVLVLVLSCKTMYCYQKDLPSTTTTFGISVKHLQSWEVVFSRGDKVSNEEDNPFFISEPNGRWKLHGRNFLRVNKAKDCSIKKYVEASSEYSVLMRVEDRSRDRIAIFTQQGRKQSFSTTQYQLFASSKWYAWRRRTSFTKGYACLTPRVPRVVLTPNSQVDVQDQHEQGGSKMPSETGSSTVVYRIKSKLHSAVDQQDTHRKDSRKVDRQIREPAEQSSRTSRTKNPSFKTWSRPRRSTSPARSRRISSLTWTTQRSLKQQCFDYNLYLEAAIVWCTLRGSQLFLNCSSFFFCRPEEQLVWPFVVSRELVTQFWSRVTQGTLPFFHLFQYFDSWWPSRELSTGLSWCCWKAGECNVFHGRSGCGRTRGWRVFKV